MTLVIRNDRLPKLQLSIQQIRRADAYGQATMSDLIEFSGQLLQCVIELNEDLTTLAHSLNSFYSYVHDMAEAADTSEGEN